MSVSKTSSLDMYLAETFSQISSLDVLKSRYYTKWTRLGVHVATANFPSVIPPPYSPPPYSINPQTLRSKMNIAISMVPAPVVNSTTPEGSQYRDCRPLWCGVPKMKSLQSSIDMVISNSIVEMNVLIA